MKKKEIKEVVPEVARLRELNVFKIKWKEVENYWGGEPLETPRVDAFTRYVIAETEEDAINKKVDNYFPNNPYDVEVVEKNSTIVRIKNSKYEELLDELYFYNNNPLDCADDIKILMPSYSKFKFNFIATRTISDEYSREIVAETKEDAIKKLREMFYNDDLTDIKEVKVEKELEVA